MTLRTILVHPKQVIPITYPSTLQSDIVPLAGHELRSVTRVVDSGDAAAEGVAVPLITLVDYR